MRRWGIFLGALLALTVATPADAEAQFKKCEKDQRP